MYTIEKKFGVCWRSLFLRVSFKLSDLRDQVHKCKGIRLQWFSHILSPMRMLLLRNTEIKIEICFGANCSLGPILGGFRYCSKCTGSAADLELSAQSCSSDEYHNERQCPQMISSLIKLPFMCVSCMRLEMWGQNAKVWLHRHTSKNLSAFVLRV